MNVMYANNNSPGGAQAPKRSNSGREILYIQNQRLIGSGQVVQESFLSPPPTHLASPQVPAEVADVFNNVLRRYSFRDIYRWLKIDRQDGTSTVRNKSPKIALQFPSLIVPPLKHVSRNQPILHADAKRLGTAHPWTCLTPINGLVHPDVKDVQRLFDALEI
jgi:hypothetical protein